MLSTPEVLRRTGGKPVKSIIYDEQTIAARVGELGAEITAAYPDGELIVLEEAVHFPLPVELETAALSGRS